MEVPVSGVKDVEHGEVVLVGDLVDGRHRVDEFRARHDGVVQVVVGRELCNGSEGRLPSLPEKISLLCVGCDLNLLRAVGSTDARDQLGLGLDSLGLSDDLGQ